MFTRFFGHYLLNEGLLDGTQLSAVLDKMSETRLRLGVIAIHEGYLTPAQVTSIHEKQQHTDKRFGEIAIEEGMLTKQQLQHLLSNQGSEYLQLVQALSDGGIMDLDRIQMAMQDYKTRHSLNDADFDSLKSGDLEPLFKRLLTGVPSNVQDYATLFYKNLVRFVTPDVHLSEISLKGDTRVASHLISQTLCAAYESCGTTGAMGALGTMSALGSTTAFTAAPDTLIRLAEKYAKEPMSGMDDYTIDVCKEFLNLHNGLFAVNMSDKGCKYDMDIQRHELDALLPAECHILKFDSSIGPVHLHIHSGL